MTTPPILISDGGKSMIAPSGRAIAGALSGSYPSPVDHLDATHRAAWRDLIQQPVTDTEIADAENYLRSVRQWGSDSGLNAPEVRERIAQAGFYLAAVQEAYARIQVSNAVRDNRPELVAAVLRRDFDNGAVASAINWGGSGINRVINGLDTDARRAMAGVLAQSPAIPQINTLAVTQLRATLRSPVDRAAFDERYPERHFMQGTVLV